MVSLSPDGKSNPVLDAVTAVVVAAGRGERVGDPAKGPKQYRDLSGKPVIRHTLDALCAHPRIGRIVVAIHADDEELLHQALSGFEGSIKIVSGGPTRQESTLRALEACEAQDGEIVLIHDAVRPFIDAATMDRVIEAAADSGAAIPALPVSDTLKRANADGYVLENVPRDGLHAAQTPQGFRFGLILQAHRRAMEEGRTDFTDDAAIAQWVGLKVRVVAGTSQNVKLTWPEDLRAAETRLKTMASESFFPDVRTGNGYDVHSFEPGDHVTLCGVDIAHSSRLSGHSDADVGLHALTDALLATCGAGDIGTHFPPSDPQWKGAASRLFVEHAVAILREHGARIANADVTLICEAPRIGDHRPAMVAAMAQMLGLDAGRVSVKATTNEKLGFIGRREGIAAIATASVVYPGSL